MAAVVRPPLCLGSRPPAAGPPGWTVPPQCGISVGHPDGCRASEPMQLAKRSAVEIGLEGRAALGELSAARSHRLDAWSPPPLQWSPQEPPTRSCACVWQKARRQGQAIPNVVAGDAAPRRSCLRPLPPHAEWRLPPLLPRRLQQPQRPRLLQRPPRHSPWVRATAASMAGGGGPVGPGGQATRMGKAHAALRRHSLCLPHCYHRRRGGAARVAPTL